MKTSFCMMGFGYTREVAERCINLASRLGYVTVQVQAHNWIGATDTSGGQLTYLDSGDLDFANYIRILKRKGFNGYISIDHPNHHPWEETAAREIGYLKRLIGGRERSEDGNEVQW